jgi:hypothetical protein
VALPQFSSISISSFLPANSGIEDEGNVDGTEDKGDPNAGMEDVTDYGDSDNADDIDADVEGGDGLQGQS